MDLVEADDHFVLKADLPGLRDEDVKIEVQDGTLTISGERKAEHEAGESGWYRIERAFGSFSRSLTLPEHVDASGDQRGLQRRRARGPYPEARGAQAAADRDPSTAATAVGRRGGVR